jgi:uncharacterized protein (DUF305 family)
MNDTDRSQTRTEGDEARVEPPDAGGATSGSATTVGEASGPLVRSQETVQDTSYIRAMIPHHSIAILTSERSELADVRVCELAVEIIEAQRREIAEMDWLIDDIDDNGAADTAAKAEARPVPEFTGTASRTCAADAAN